MRVSKLFGIESVLLTAAVSTLPIYIFASGGLQPSHMFFFGFALWHLSKHGYLPQTWSLIFLVLFLHVMFVEGIYVVFGAENDSLLHAAFFLFNFLVTAAIYSYVKRNGLGIISLGVNVAASVALASVLISGVDLQQMAEAGRETATFNNPNQLGFFSVCLLSITYLLYRTGDFSYLHSAVLFAVAIFLAILSLSKAAIIANLIVLVIALIPKSSIKLRILAFIFIGAFSAFLISLYLSGEFNDYLFAQRLNSISEENDSSLASRGYFAFLQADVVELVFGFGGEGVLIVNHGDEVHSTLASMLNQYGLLGFTLFTLLLVNWCRALYRAFDVMGVICIAGPILLYGITHNGTRFAFFWLLFAASYSIADRKSKRTRVPKRVKPFVTLDPTANRM